MVAIRAGIIGIFSPTVPYKNGPAWVFNLFWLDRKHFGVQKGVFVVGLPSSLAHSNSAELKNEKDIHFSHKKLLLGSHMGLEFEPQIFLIPDMDQIKDFF